MVIIEAGMQVFSGLIGKSVVLASMMLSLSVSSTMLNAQESVYQRPSAELQALVDAPRGPEVRMGPENRHALVMQVPNLPSIAEVSQSELKLAGLRVHPKMRAAMRINFNRNLSILDVDTGKMREVTGISDNARIADVAWSPDERFVAFSVWSKTGVELWLLNVKTANAQRLINEKLNAVTGAGFSWLKGSEQLLVRLVPTNQKRAPNFTNIPSGPNVLETRGGKASQIRTFVDVLRTSRDADMLEWQLQTQLAVVHVNGLVQRITPNLALNRVQASPDGKWLITTQVRRPYSFQLPLERFAQVVDLWSIQGKKIKTLVEVPMRERLPSNADAVQAGPRNFSWRNDLPSTLVWLEAQAGGDPEINAKVHDVMWQQNLPITHAPQKLIELGWRFQSILWGHDGLALVTESWQKTRDTRTWRIAPGQTNARPDLLFQRKSEDNYAHPGNPVTHLNQYGRPILLTSTDGQFIYLTGQGASPEGDRPFLDRLHLNTEKITRLWRSKAPHYEEVIGLLDDNAQAFITSRESVDERPNLVVRHLNQANPVRMLTTFPHPTPYWKGVQRRQINFEREDGVNLSATLYMPAGYDPKRDGARPMLMWAYPREFKSAEAAGQMGGSPYKFNRINFNGPQVMLARGFTVLDNLAMPIIGEGKKEPNDTFIDQIKMNAEAAVDEVVRLGVADRQRIAIGGHSYGAFMTVNLLAHTKLFRVGIARSGAYNRSLTPFGFQSEDRSYWRAQETYHDMSPFNYANDIDAPILLIHGEDDNNSGTFPIQSERMYQALQGLGVPSRLVMLPHESHAYLARESILHMLYEQEQWLLRHMKSGKTTGGRLK
jgi:dipeptidyl aminopeptidase/acylaminoacyl peptidase